MLCCVLTRLSNMRPSCNRTQTFTGVAHVACPLIRMFQLMAHTCREDSRYIALAITVCLAALVAFSPLIRTLDGLWHGPATCATATKPAPTTGVTADVTLGPSVKASQSSASAVPTDDEMMGGARQQHDGQAQSGIAAVTDAGTGSTINSGGSSTAADAAAEFSAKSHTAVKHPATADAAQQQQMTKQQLAKKNKHQLAGLAILVVRVQMSLWHSSCMSCACFRRTPLACMRTSEPSVQLYTRQTYVKIFIITHVSINACGGVAVGALKQTGDLCSVCVCACRWR